MKRHTVLLACAGLLLGFLIRKYETSVFEEPLVVLSENSTDGTEYRFCRQLETALQDISEGKQKPAEIEFTDISCRVETADEQQAALNRFQTLYRRTIRDHPEISWWVDGAASVRMKTETVSDDETKSIRVISISVPVIQEFLEGADISSAYRTLADTALSNALDEVRRCSSLPDQEKLAAMGGYIRKNTSYDKETAERFVEGDAGYGMEWQFLSVLDEDPATMSVCEGYAKAFKTLCDLTEFSSDVECRCVTGTLKTASQSASHMWNILTIDGKEYLADLTLADTGYSSLFLVEPVSVPGGYRSGSVTYYVDS